MRAQDRKVPYQALSTSFRGAKCRLGEPCNYRSPSDLIYRKCYGKRRRSRSRSPIDLAACSAAEPSSAGSSLCSRRCGGVALAEKKSADRRRLGRAARSEQNTNQVVVGGRSRFALSSHCDGVFGGAVDEWPKTSGTTSAEQATDGRLSRRRQARWVAGRRSIWTGDRSDSSVRKRSGQRSSNGDGGRTFSRLRPASNPVGGRLREAVGPGLRSQQETPNHWKSCGARTALQHSRACVWRTPTEFQASLNCHTAKSSGSLCSTSRTWDGGPAGELISRTLALLVLYPEQCLKQGCTQSSGR